MKQSTWNAIFFGSGALSMGFVLYMMSSYVPAGAITGPDGYILKYSWYCVKVVTN